MNQMNNLDPRGPAVMHAIIRATLAQLERQWKLQPSPVVGVKVYSAKPIRVLTRTR